MINVVKYVVSAFSLALFLSWGCCVPVWAGFDEGVAAYSAGDFDGAAREFTLMAEQGDALSQYHLGLLYEEGQGVTKNLASARQWYLKAANQGNADAMFALGQIYARGIGVKPDIVAAYRWYEQAARSKHRLSAQERDYLARAMSDSELMAAKRLIGETVTAHIH